MLGPTIGIRRASPSSHSVLNDMASLSPGHISYVPTEESGSAIAWKTGGAILWKDGGKILWNKEE